MILGREAEPLFDVWIVGGVTCAPDTGKAHFRAGQQHILHGGGGGFDILDVEDVGLLWAFGRYDDQHGRAQRFMAFFLKYGLFVGRGLGSEARSQRCDHDLAKSLTGVASEDKETPRFGFMMVGSVGSCLQQAFDLFVRGCFGRHFADTATFFYQVEGCHPRISFCEKIVLPVVSATYDYSITYWR